MTKLQKQQLKINQSTAELNKLVDQVNESPSDKLHTELEKRSAELKQDYKVLSTLKLLDQSSETIEKRDASPDTEAKKFDALVRQCKISNFLLENTQTGADLELRQATNCKSNEMPLQLLDPALERRADAVSEVSSDATITNQLPTLERIFFRSVAAYLGCSMQSVQPGTPVYPYLETGTAGRLLAPGEPIESRTATISTVSGNPKRLTGRYKWRVEDAAKLGEFESVLRKDLTAILTIQMDHKIINGQGAGETEIDNFLSLAAGDKPTAAFEYRDYLDLFTSAVDGITATSKKDVKALIGPETYRKMESKYISVSTGSDVSIAEHLQNKAGGFMVSRLIPNEDEDNIQSLIAVNSAYPQVASVVPIWNNLELIRDNITLASTGEVLTTAVMLFDHKFIRASSGAYYRKYAKLS